MEKQTIYLEPGQSPRTPRENGRSAERQGVKRPMTEAEKRRRLAMRKKRRRQKRIRKLVLAAVLVLAVLLLLLLIVRLVQSRSAENAEPEMVEVQEFIGLNDADGNFATVLAYGTYGAWLRLQGNFAPTAGKTVTSVSLELHDAYETKLVPWEEAYPEEAAARAAEEEAKKGIFAKLFTKKEEPETETETETEYVPIDHSGKAVYPLNFTTDESGNVWFLTAEKLNEGLTLERMPEGAYTMLLRADYADGSEERYSLSDLSSMSPVEYYTITQNNANDKITLAFDANEGGSFLLYTREDAALPAEIYDFVIDAGHGGKDPGASNSQITEAELTLQYAKGIAEKLSAMGYKVLLTRDGTESPDEDMAYTMYDENGRVNKACASRAKVGVSIHFNSNAEVTAGGVEVYCSGRNDYTLAALLADTIVAESGASYSGQKSFKVADGVYVKTYTEQQIADSNTKAANNNFAAYDLTTDTDYLYMIRELGGIWTNAYIDGRNPYYGENLYRDSNMGVEAYLIEMAFMSVADDIQNAVQNADAYEQGVADALHAWHTGLLAETSAETSPVVPIDNSEPSE